MVSHTLCLLILGLHFGASNFVSIGKYAHIYSRLLTDVHPAEETANADLIKIRSTEIWTSGLAYDCHAWSRQIQTENQSELEFRFRLNVSQLPEEYPSELSYDFRMWYLNRLLNGPHKMCRFATGEGQSIDAFPSNKVSMYGDHSGIPNRAIAMPRDRYILVGPRNESLCLELSNKMHNQRRMFVSGCEIVETSSVPVDGYILAKYYLNTTEFRCDLEPYEYHDVDILFLQELNRGASGCEFNGHWGGVAADHEDDYQVLDELRDEPSEEDIRLWKDAIEQYELEKENDRQV